MNRLVDLVAGAVADRAMAFHTGEIHTAASTIRVYPVAWLEPPAVVDHQGRREGFTTWKIALHLAALPSADPSAPSGAEAIIRVLHAHALEVARALAESPLVCSVTDIGCESARQSLTPHGEVSVALTCKVALWYQGVPANTP